MANLLLSAYLNVSKMKNNFKLKSVKYYVSVWFFVSTFVQSLDSNRGYARKEYFPQGQTSWILSRNSSLLNSDIYLTTPQLIEKYGFLSESHSVETEDHYYIVLHRIPYGRNETKMRGFHNSTIHFPKQDWKFNSTSYYSNQTCVKGKPVVFLMHGIGCSSSDWLMNSVDKALPYKLADAGYDVWIGNARGNTYSTRHKFLPNSDGEYWNFSFHEMGVYDNVAAIDYILNRTDQNSLFYIGHSTGATLLFITLSARPEYAAKIRFFGAASPVVFLANSISPLAKIPLISIISRTSLGNTIFNGNVFNLLLTNVLHKIAPKLCGNPILSKKFCKNLLYVIAGFDGPQINHTQLPVIVSHTPSPTSIKTITHFLQYFKTDRFSMFDFGWWKNYHKYGSFIPPEYDLRRTTVPTAIFYGLNDLITVPKDSRKLAKRVPNLVVFAQVKWPLWNHLDAIYAKDADIFLYDPLMTLMQNYKFDTRF